MHDPIKTTRTITVLALICLPLLAQARPATMRCKTTVSTYSWQPLPMATITRVVEGRVLQVLTRSGKLTALAAGGKAPDLTLKVAARIIEDAQQFSVFISATPRRQNKAGSLASVATRSINNKNHKAIQAVMEKVADEAARKLRKALTPFLPTITRDALDRKVVPLDLTGGVDWARALQLKGGGGRAVGAGALQQLRARARKEAGARMALARCAVHAGKPGIQTRCIDALAQLARRHPSAQRAIIAVLFSAPPRRHSGPWQKARRRAFRITTSFTGAALQEAIQSWLFMLASDHSDNYYLFGGRREDYLIMDTVSKYLARRPNLPNLDLALGQCSRPAKKKGAPPDSYCLRVMKAVPVQRRLSLLYRQLAKPPRYSFYSPYKAWISMLKTVVDRHKPLHPAVEQLCMQRIQRSFWDGDRKECLTVLGRQGKPTRRLVKFLVAVFASASKGILFASRDSLHELVKRKPALCPVLEKTLGPIVARGAYPRHYPRKEVPRSLRHCRKKK